MAQHKSSRLIINHIIQRTLITLLVTASALSSAAVLAAGQEPALLEQGKTVERELAGGQTHVYQLALVEGQYANVIVEQRGIDLAVELQTADGKLVASFNDEEKSQGEEKIEFVAEATNYRLIIKAVSKAAPVGTYKMYISEVRAASETDRLMHEARKLAADGKQAFLDGRYEDGRQFTERALSISENVLGKEHSFVAALLSDLANNYYDDKQDFAKAISLMERALAISEKASGKEHPKTIDISRLLAYIYFETNDVARAERLGQHAFEVSQKTRGLEHPLTILCLHTLAQFIRNREEVEQMLKQALALGEKVLGPEHTNTAIILNDLGVFYTENGDYQQAEQFLLRSQAIYEKTRGPWNICQVISLFNLGRIARERKDYAKAEACYAKAIAIVDKVFGPENPRLAIILNNIANIYRAKGEYAKSLDAHLRVLRVAEATRGPYHPLTQLSLGNIAKTYAAQGNIAEAIKFQSRVDAVIERNIKMNLIVGSERQKLSYLNLSAERTDRTISLNSQLAPDDQTASELAALVLLQRKGRVLDAMSDSFVSLREKSTPEEQALLKRYNDITAQLARLVLNGPQGISFQEHQKKVRELEEEKDRLEGEISRRSAQFRAGSQLVTLATVQAAIPAGAALIEFAIYRPFDPKAESNNEAYKATRYVAYVMHQRGEVRWRDLGDAEEIDQHINALRQALRDPKRSDVQRLARAVDEKIMRPVRALLGDATQLLISPDGALNLIPFEALVDEQNRYLVQRFACTYLTSGRDLLRLQVARASKSSPVVLANPLFGEPDFIATAPKSQRALSFDKQQRVTSGADLSDVYFPPLAGTAQEAKAIKSLFAEASLLTGAQATESALKQVSAPRLLHIATHGFFLTDDRGSSLIASGEKTRAINANAKIENPLLRSGLALAGANLNKGGDDGILTAMEASGLNLWGTKLVTLSACDTGLGEVKNGEGVYGLRRAFVLAGAESLVLSLWPVSDYVTREMMTAYYTGLKQGQGRGAALRQVQLNLLKRKARAHPFYWASFIQSGEWANLDGKR